MKAVAFRTAELHEAIEKMISDPAPRAVYVGECKRGRPTLFLVDAELVSARLAGVYGPENASGEDFAALVACDILQALSEVPDNEPDS